MLEKVEETVEEKPEKAVMDAGYCSKDNLEKARRFIASVKRSSFWTRQTVNGH